MSVGGKVQVTFLQSCSGKIAQCTVPLKWVMTVTLLNSLNWTTCPKRQTSDTPTYTSAAPWPANPPSALQARPIKVKEAFQIKLMGADVGPLFRLSVDVSPQNRLTVWGQCLSHSRAVRSHSHTCLSKERAAGHHQREDRESQSKQEEEGESFHIFK